MGMIGRWVDEMVRHEPQMMQEVLEAEWGDLGMWIDPDCAHGCLVGSCILAMVRRNSASLYDFWGAELPPLIHYGQVTAAFQTSSAPQWIADSWEAVGRRVYDLASNGLPGGAEQQARIVRIVKQRIARRLHEAVPVEPNPKEAACASI